MAQAMLEGVPGAVRKLQGRLLAGREPHRLRRYLKQLSALPVTAEILAQTGVRKTVKRLRKHEQVGAQASALAAQWKSLVLAQPKPGSGRRGYEERGGAEGRGGDALPPAEPGAGGFAHKCAAPARPAGSPEPARPGLPELPTPPRSSPTRRQSTASSEKRPTSAPPASPPWELFPHLGHLHAPCPDSRLPPPPRCEQHYGSLAAMGATTPAPTPARRHALASRDPLHGMPLEDPLWGTQEQAQEDSWSTQRTHSKTPVYSGSAAASPQPKRAFYERFRQVLCHNLDAIYDASFIPDCVLQPVLEKCSPHQLRRIETCNPGLAEKTDHLWKTHCHREFKDQQPEAPESWREMYLRLQDARAQRLQDVTNRIRLARASEPEARKAKLLPLSTVSKARQQKNVGFGGPGGRAGGGGAGEGGAHGGGGGVAEKGRGRATGVAGGEGGARAGGRESGGKGAGGRETRPAAAGAVAAAVAAAAAEAAAAAAEATAAARAAAEEAAAAAAAAAAALAAGATTSAAVTLLPKAILQGTEQSTGRGISPSGSGSGSGSPGCCLSPAAQAQASASPSPARLAFEPPPHTRKPAPKRIGSLIAKSMRDDKKILSRR